MEQYEDRIFTEAKLPNAFGLVDSLATFTGEVVANVRQHARIDHYWILAQYYPKSNNTCEIVIADTGIGYKSSYNGTKFKVESDAEAIRNAFEGKSSKSAKRDSDERGAGIRSIANLFLNGFKGKLIIISGKSIQYYKQGKTSERKEIELPCGWGGAIVCVYFDAKDLNALDYLDLDSSRSRFSLNNFY